ncbi:MAG: hypothetical protein JXR96_19415 [Deltaproteobacteria bacterium]|nr:hypothetical protein [Deltaproteobacteria bacterium]
MSGLRMATLALLAAAGCSTSSGTPVDPTQLGYQPCDHYFDCGPGRYCTAEGLCWADCRTTADCALVASGGLCNPFGQCVEQGGGEPCTSHADCGDDNYCNGTCSIGGAVCGDSSECSYEGTCSGTCAPNCGKDDDCLAFDPGVPDTEFLCTPVGKCLLTGWERWIPPGELPPTSCTRDAECKALGWAWVCDCVKELDAWTGRRECIGGAESVCVQSEEPLDFGSGPASSPAHEYAGVWGMRMEIGVVTEVPIIGYQNTYSSNLFLVIARHTAGDTLEMEEKLCDLKLINFIDSDEPFDDLGWMIIPARYIRSVAMLDRSVELPLGGPGADWRTSRTTEVRGCVIDDDENDPLPDRADFLADPDDPRFWDEDRDGNVGMTTLMDGILRGKVYNVQRWSATYDGQIVDSDHIKGLASIQNEQLVISASKPSLVPPNSQSAIHDQADRTYFRMLRLPDDASCADLIREAEHAGSYLMHSPHLDDVSP